MRCYTQPHNYITKYDLSETFINQLRSYVDLPPIKLNQKSNIKQSFTLEYIKESNKLATGVFKTLKTILNDKKLCNDNIYNCFKGDELINLINNRTKPNGDPYAINSKLKYFHALIKTIDTFPDILGKSHDKYSEIYKKCKENADIYNLDKQLNEKVISFPDLMQRIKDKYTEDSEEYLMIATYDQITPRNDLQDISFNTCDPNHIDLKKGSITIKKFNKTNKLYKGIINYKLSKDYMKLLFKSLNMKNKTDKPSRDILFTKKIATLFKNTNTAVNVIRHSKISTELNTMKSKLDGEKRSNLAEKMLHSSATQLKYIRELQ